MNLTYKNHKFEILSFDESTLGGNFTAKYIDEDSKFLTALIKQMNSVWLNVGAVGNYISKTKENATLEDGKILEKCMPIAVRFDTDTNSYVFSFNFYKSIDSAQITFVDDNID